MSTGAPIDTKKVAGRREVRYGTLDDALADVEALVAAGPVRALGNWTAAMNVQHVAFPIGFAVDGYPPEAAKTPFLVKTMMRLMKNRVLEKGFGPGIKPPPDIAKTFAPDPDVTMDAALELFRANLAAARQRGMAQPNPLLGRLTPDEYERFNCRHAELHFSFIVPAG
ncbi:MAG: DUF1569 domain-containing protein [Planctomycetota bacterium]